MSKKILLAGESWMSYTTHVKGFDAFHLMKNSSGEDLTPTEWKVIREVEKGKSNKEIADKLCLSDGTIRNYISTILDKLDLRDRTQLALWAVQASLN